MTLAFDCQVKNTSDDPAVMSRQTAGVSILGVIMYTFVKQWSSKNFVILTCRALVRSSSPWVTFFRNSLTKVNPRFSHIIASVAEFWTEVVFVDFSCRIIAWRFGNFSRSVSYFVRIFDILPLNILSKSLQPERALPYVHFHRLKGFGAKLVENGKKIARSE